MRRGRFIVVEGMEGAGKSTAIDTISASLTSQGIDFLITREPGGTAIGEVLRELVKNVQFKGILTARTELLLMYASRIQLVEEIIRPALARGEWVLSDRFELSSFAYQGGGRALDIAFMKQLSHFSLEGLRPDLTLFLDVTPELGLMRAQGRGAFDRIEQESLSFFQRVHAAYLEYLKEDDSIKRIDAEEDLYRVKKQLQAHVEDLIQSDMDEVNKQA